MWKKKDGSYEASSERTILDIGTEKLKFQTQTVP